MKAVVPWTGHLWVVGFLLLISSGVAEVPLVSQGRSVVQVVPAPGVRPAVAELLRASLPDRRDGDSHATTVLRLGIDSSLDSGFSVEATLPNAVSILGADHLGLEQGVHRFLEEHLGVRWLMPGDTWTVVPSLQKAAVPVGRRVSRPAFEHRWLSGLPGAAGSEWARRMRLHLGVDFMHGLHRLYPPVEERFARPFLYAEQNGVRRIPPPGLQTGWQVCFTAEGSATTAASRILEALSRPGKGHTAALGVNDGWLGQPVSGHCLCSRCLAAGAGKEVNVVGYRSWSEPYYRWAGEVCREVEKVRPQAVLGCLAYAEVWDPPSERIPDNLMPFLCYERLRWQDPDVRAKHLAASREWTRQGRRVGWYDYGFGGPYLLPRIDSAARARNYRAAKRMGVTGVVDASYPWWLEGPKYWIAARLMWNPRLDPQLLLEDWCRNAVGKKGAPTLLKYYQFWEKVWLRRVPKTPWFLRGRQWLEFTRPEYLDAVSLKEVREAGNLLAECLRKSKGKAERERAGLLVDWHREVEVYREAWSLFRDDKGASMSSREQRMKQLVSEWGGLNSAEASSRSSGMNPSRFPPLQLEGWLPVPALKWPAAADPMDAQWIRWRDGEPFPLQEGRLGPLTAEYPAVASRDPLLRDQPLLVFMEALLVSGQEGRAGLPSACEVRILGNTEKQVGRVQLAAGEWVRVGFRVPAQAQPSRLLIFMDLPDRRDQVFLRNVMLGTPVDSPSEGVR